MGVVGRLVFVGWDVAELAVQSTVLCQYHGHTSRPFQRDMLDVVDGPQRAGEEGARPKFRTGV